MAEPRNFNSQSQISLFSDDCSDRDWLELGLGSGQGKQEPNKFKGVVCSSAQGTGFHHDGNLGFCISSSGFDHDGYGLAGFEVDQGGFGSGSRSESVTLNLFQTAASSTPQDVSGCVVKSCNHHGLRLHHDMDLVQPWNNNDPTLDFYRRRQLQTGTCLGLTRISHWPRSETGLWFSLHASHCQNRDEALPQIPKAYLRVKDENVTILTVKTYLVRKLGLSSESEIDILCKGQKLLHSQTVKYVRDEVWLPGVIDSLNEMTSTETLSTSTEHFMPLHYQRNCFYN